MTILFAAILTGGETAEMPGMYQDGDYDLAGFAVGAVERPMYLPRVQDIQEGDAVIGLQSAGLHSNGFSLVRKIVDRAALDYKAPSPFEDGKTLGGEFSSVPLLCRTLREIALSVFICGDICKQAKGQEIQQLLDISGASLLKPTAIYCQTVLPLMRSGLVKAFAHITGGGLPGNVPRVLPEGLGVHLDAKSWFIDPVFGWLFQTVSRT